MTDTTINRQMLIALCGHPKSGKSEVQRFLQEYGVKPIDDGRPLRRFAMENLGLSNEDVYTQEGKMREFSIGDQSMTVRKFLGEFGNALESKFGADFIPELAVRSLHNQYGWFSFGSVRREQGRVYQRHGGIIVEIVRPGVGPSEHEFDRYNADIVDYRITNDGDLEQLRTKVRDLYNSLDKRIDLVA